MPAEAVSVLGMSKSKPRPDQPEDSPPDKSGKAGFKYVGIPLALWERLKRYADQDERSINWAAKKAIKDFLDRADAD